MNLGSHPQVSDQGNQPCVDVIIVTYNRSAFVLNSVESVLFDSYEKKDIIVVDDASVDGTAEMLRAAFPNQIRVLVNDRAQFLGASRNRGMVNSGAKYVLSMDDDCLIPDGNVIGELVGVLERNEDLAAVGPAVYASDGKMAYCGAKAFPVFRPLRPRSDRRTLVRCEYVPGTIGMYRREALEKVGGWDPLPWQAEDADLCLRLKEAGYEVVCAPWIKATHLKTGLVDIPNEERAYRSGIQRMLLFKSHHTKTTYIAWLIVTTVPVTLFYVLFLTCRYRLRGLSL